MADEEKGCWFTTKTGVHVFVKDGQTVEEAIEERFGKKGKSAPKKGAAAKKMTPAEKIASVHIDFDKDNVLPELEEDALKIMGVKKSKRVLLKKSVIDRNAERHPDVKPEDAERLIGETLYSPDDIFPGRSSTGKYFSFVRLIEYSKKDGRPKHGVVLLDVNEQNDCFQIVHWHWTKKKETVK